MRTLVLSILWAFAGNFGTAADIPVKQGLEAYQLTGRWYPIALVTVHEDLDNFLAAGKYIMPTSRDDLDIDLYHVEDKDCILEILSFVHDKRPGQFITESENPDLDGHKVHIVDTDYEEYNIFHMEQEGNSTLFLDGREPTVSAAIRQRFNRLASSLKFPATKILNVPNNDFCFANKKFW